MTDDEMQELLRAVADGELSPEDAARRIGGNPAPGPQNAADDPTAAFGEPHTEPLSAGLPHASGLRRVRVRANAGIVRVIGDDSVLEAVVDGAHAAERVGDELTIECESLFRAFTRDDRVGAGAYATMPPGRTRLHPRFPFNPGLHHAVRVRMNPALALDVELVAGSLAVEGVEGPIVAVVSAGSAALRGVRGPVEASISAGSLSISGRLDHGRSSVTCDMGSAAVRLEPGSDLRVEATTTMGRTDIRLPRAPEGDAWVLGSGRGELHVHSTMSAVSVVEV